MIDVHCHLTDPSLWDRLPQIIEEAKAAGVLAIVSSGIGPEDCEKVLAVADDKYVFASLGIEPYELHGYEEVVAMIERNRHRLVGIGEVGLDYRAGGRETRELQKKIFNIFIDLCKELDKPLFVHSRSAGKYALEELFQAKAERVVMHAFDGSSSYAERGASKGYYFSVPPSIARSEQKQKMVRRLPLENLLLESDAPVLGPEKAVVNEPKNILVSAHWIAKLKNLSVDHVIEKTTLQACELLRLPVTI